MTAGLPLPAARHEHTPKGSSQSFPRAFPAGSLFLEQGDRLRAADRGPRLSYGVVGGPPGPEDLVVRRTLEYATPQHVDPAVIARWLSHGQG